MGWRNARTCIFRRPDAQRKKQPLDVVPPVEFDRAPHPLIRLRTAPLHPPLEKQPRLGALLDASRDDVLAYMSFPRENWAQSHRQIRSNG
jgi:hypothetical protein